MAFGGRKGGLVAAANSITNPTVASGSVAVLIGDLVYGVIAEQNSSTASTVTDNLGNTYSAITAGTFATSISGRAYYSRVTSSGTLTAVNFSATASTNNVVALADVFEGPFAASPLDTSPANITEDLSSPFTCPGTTVRTQYNEAILCFGAEGTNNAWSASTPNTLGGQQASQTVVELQLGSQVVDTSTSLSSIAPAWTGTAPAHDVLGTASFKQNTFFLAEPYEWSPHFPRRAPADLYTWTLNSTRFIAAGLPPGAQTYALTGRPYRLEQSIVQTPLPELYGRDTFLPQQNIYQWFLPGRYPRLEQTWIQPPVATVVFPYNQYVWPLPGRYPRQEQTWLESTLLPQPNPVVPIDWPLPGRYPRLDQTWIQQLLPVDFAVPFLNRWDLPRAPSRLDQTWIQQLLPQEFVVVLPYNQYDWPLPGKYPRLDQTWLQNTRIGQDTFLPQQNLYQWPLPGRPFRIDQTWVFPFNPNLLPLPVGGRIYDLTGRPPRLEQTWLQELPPGALATPFVNLWYLPTRALRIDETWVQALAPYITPAGNPIFPVSDWTPPGRFIPLRIDESIGQNLVLFTPSGAPPPNQLDWPLTGRPALVLLVVPPNFLPLQTFTPQVFQALYMAGLCGGGSLFAQAGRIQSSDAD